MNKKYNKYCDLDAFAGCTLISVGSTNDEFEGGIGLYLRKPDGSYTDELFFDFGKSIDGGDQRAIESLEESIGCKILSGSCLTSQDPSNDSNFNWYAELILDDGKVCPCRKDYVVLNARRRAWSVPAPQYP